MTFHFELIIHLFIMPPMQKSLKQEHFLWQLLNIQKDTEKANEDLDVEEHARKEIVDELGNYESEASKKKKEQSGYLKEIARCERRITEKQNGLDKNVRLSFFHHFLLLLLCFLLNRARFIVLVQCTH